MSKMPQQRPWDSEQTVETPRDLLDAIETRWGKLHVDLACSRNVQCVCDPSVHGYATQDNRKAPEAIVFPDEDALTVPWAERYHDKRCFCNPPFRLCGEFARKAERESRSFDTNGAIFLLTPASVGANWYRDYVHRKALVYVLSPRLTFVGHDEPYPKDMMLTVFSNADGSFSYFDIWGWETAGMRARRHASKVEDIDSL